MQRVDAAEALLDELLQAPAGAVAGEHGQVVQVDGRGAVRLGDLVVVDLGEPVVGGDGAGVGEDEAAHGVGDGGVLLDAPVVDLEVVVDDVLVVEQGGVDVADLLTLLAVEDVGFGNRLVSAAGQHGFGAVLDVFHRNKAVADLRQEVRRDFQRQKINDALGIVGTRRFERLFDGLGNFIDIETDNLSVPLDYIIHFHFLQTPCHIPRSLTAGSFFCNMVRRCCISSLENAERPSP